ncbi:MAG: MerR family transcriptional regulator [Spirochaetes bacterium]|nr:MerR family transcriptional regulator [Spirochaetota bacterium]
MLTISEFSAASRLTVKTLRMYHEEGILVPEKIEPSSGYRYYGDAAWQRAQSLCLLRELGFSHRELKEIVQDCHDDCDLQQHLAKRLSAVKQELVHMRGVHDRLAVYLDTAKEHTMKVNNTIQLKEVPETIICGIRFKGAYDEIGKYFGILFKKAGRYMRGPAMALYYDSEYRDSDADIEAAIVVSKIPQLDDDSISCRILPAQKVLSLLHYGPYDQLGKTYRRLFEARSERNLASLVPSRELYLKGPGMILPRKPEKFVTEIQIPVQDQSQESKLP